MLTHEEEIKLRLFESIAANAEKLHDRGYYMSPSNVAENVNNVYNKLFTKPEEE